MNKMTFNKQLKQNATFAINSDVLKAFKTRCEQNAFIKGRVIELLIKHWLEKQK